MPGLVLFALTAAAFADDLARSRGAPVRLVAPERGKQVASLKFTTDGNRLVSVDDEWGSLTWDLKRRVPLTRLPVQPKPDSIDPNVPQSPDGTLALWDEAGDRRLFLARDRKTEKEIYRLTIRDDSLLRRLYAVEFSPDGRLFLFHCGGLGFGLDVTPVREDFAVYDARTGKAAFSVRLDNVDGVAAAFSPDGTRLVLAARPPNRTTKLFDARIELISLDTQTGKSLNRRYVAGESSQLWVMPDNRTALTLSELDSGHRLYRWDARTGEILQIASSHWFVWRTGGVNSNTGAVLSPDGQLLTVVTRDSLSTTLRVRVISTNTFEEVVGFPWPKHDFFPALRSREVPTALSISPTNRTLAVGLSNGSILLYTIPPLPKPKGK